MFEKIDTLVDHLLEIGVLGLDFSIRVHGDEVHRRMETMLAPYQ